MRCHSRMHIRVCIVICGGAFDQPHAQNGSTALMMAVSDGRVDCAKLLLDAGADKNATDKVRDRTIARVLAIR